MKKENSIIVWTLPIALSMTIICFAALFSLHFRGLYYWDIEYLSISQDAHMDEDQIRQNYDILVDYMTDEKIEKLAFPNFGMSREGEIHFKEVKDIFILIKRLMYGLGIYSIMGILVSIIKKRYKFIKYTAMGILAGPACLLLVAMIDFDKSFVIFHNLAFSNTYWIFDPVKDPVIMILPQDYFLHSFLLIVGIVLIIALILTILYRVIRDQIKMEE